MLGKMLLISFSVFCIACSNPKTEEEPKNKEQRISKEEFRTVGSEQDTIQLLFVGDLLLDRGVREKIKHAGIETLFSSSIDSVFSSNDLVIANLECPATLIEEPVNKKYIFRADPVWLNTLKAHKISHLNLANNHSMDQGRNGLIDTDKNIREVEMISLGFGFSADEACKAKLIVSEPRNIYLLSSLQVSSENWLYFENKPCVCERSLSKIEIQVEALKKADKNCIVLVQLHWGIEHVSVPNYSQKQAVLGLVNAGADCIIGHHPHVVQTVENINGTPVFYSIGNFIFDQKKPINSRGIMVQLEITDTTFKADTIPFIIDNCVPSL